MRTYKFNKGDKLTFSVNQKKWRTIVFEEKDFADPGAATADEIAAVIKRSGELTASLDENGDLVLETVEKGGRVSLEIDTENTSALFRNTDQAVAVGYGLRSARLVGLVSEPFDLALGSEMTLFIDGQKHRIVFGTGFRDKKALAEEVAAIINAKKKNTAFVLRNKALMLCSQKNGEGSELRVSTAADPKRDAAQALGFVGSASEDLPYPSAPARIVCNSTAHPTEVINLTAGPIELHTGEGSIIVPARKSVPISVNDTANTQLQNLIGKGVVKLSAGQS